MTAKLKSIKVELRRRMHAPIIQQAVWLRAVVNGYFNYHAVPTNVMALSKLSQPGVTSPPAVRASWSTPGSAKLVHFATLVITPV